MIKRVNPNMIEEDFDFPYDFKSWAYPVSLLKSTLYTVWWTEIDDNGNETVLLMDYDGFAEWYTKEMDSWLMDDNTVNWKEYPAEEYLPHHIGRTICPVKEVKA